MTAPNYRETAVNGTQWRRAYSVLITNPLDDLNSATINFQEEDVLLLPGGEKIVRPVGSLSATFNPVGNFSILNPETGAVVNSMTHPELYAILYSLYMKLAQERDGV